MVPATRLIPSDAEVRIFKRKGGRSTSRHRLHALFVNGRLNDQTCGFLSHLGYPGSGGPLFAYPAACSHAADRFAVRDERNSPMIHNRAPLARLLLLEGKSYEEISL